jgi:hypothetical protein
VFSGAGVWCQNAPDALRVETDFTHPTGHVDLGVEPIEDEEAFGSM